jgi:hypothetical protein
MRVARFAAVAFALALPALIVHAEESVRTVVDRASAYVADYQQKLSMVVAQERYDQEVRYPAAPMSRNRDLTSATVLLSDFLLVRGPDGSWLPFRDVYERDGVPVRDREERLSALFIDGSVTALERARRIAEESARYNIGNVSRNINLPTLPLQFLTDAHRGRFDFEFDGPLSDGVRSVRYREQRGPSYIRTTNNRDLPASGRLWIREDSGRIERSELRTSDAGLDALIVVTYRPDDTAGLWVPGRMEERYVQKNDRSEIRGTAVYSRYRRFLITTSDELAK